jgi:site-specific DNA-methyltransferase (adenine-specific)
MRQSKKTSQNIGHSLADLACSFPHESVENSMLILGDTFQWLRSLPSCSIHAIVTDPPYGVKEYEFDQMEKRDAGKGGVWRIPPKLGGYERAPLPRFTALNQKERNVLADYFVSFAHETVRVLKPGAHVFLASNAFISQLVFSACVEGGLEFRGEVIRLVRTLRGGDRPKNAEGEFPGVSSMPRGCYEPWGIFRNPMPARMKVSDCLREHGTGGLRRESDERPFGDVIDSERTPQEERRIAAHPSIKPQSLMRRLVHAALPLGSGIVADPFMGSGSTIAAALALGYQAIGVERFPTYFQMAKMAIPKLAAVKIRSDGVPPSKTEWIQERLFG